MFPFARSTLQVLFLLGFLHCFAIGVVTGIGYWPSLLPFIPLALILTFCVWAALCIANDDSEIPIFAIGLLLAASSLHLLIENSYELITIGRQKSLPQGLKWLFWLIVAAWIGIVLCLMFWKYPQGGKPSALQTAGQVILAAIYVASTFLFASYYFRPHLYVEATSVVNNFPLLDLRYLLSVSFLLLGLAEASISVVTRRFPRYQVMFYAPRVALDNSRGIVAAVLAPILIIGRLLVVAVFSVLDVLANLIRMSVLFFIYVGVEFMSYARDTALSSRLWRSLRDVTVTVAAAGCVAYQSTVAAKSVQALNGNGRGIFSATFELWSHSALLLILFLVSISLVGLLCWVWKVSPPRFLPVPNLQVIPWDIVLSAGVWLFLVAWLSALALNVVNFYFRFSGTQFIEPGIFTSIGCCAIVLGMMIFLARGLRQSGG